jgi:hypothetical protein
MHVGSIYAVRSPDALVQGGSKFEMNKFQQQMYDNWCWARDELIQQPDVLCLNGEPIDGSNVKNTGGSTWNTDVNAQLEDAERLIRMYRWRDIVVTRGSRYHVAVQNTFHEDIIARNLGAVPYSGLFGDAVKNLKQNKTESTENPRQYTDFYLRFMLGGRHFNVCHHVGYNKTELYRTTAMGRELATSKLAEGKWYPKGENIDVFVRSHVHYYVQVRFLHQIGFTTPCWKFPDEFMLRKGIGGTAVDIGTIEVIIEPNGHIDVYEHIISNDKYPKPKEINFDDRLA